MNGAGEGGLRQSMDWLHTWTGLLFGWLLYFMFITGSFGYFNAEIDAWMRPELGSGGLPPLPAAELVQRAQARLQERMPHAEEWWIGLPRAGRGNPEISLYARMPSPAEGAQGEEFNARLDPATGGDPPKARDTGGGDQLYVMHYALRYIDYEWAYRIVGVATALMLIAIVTGVVVHRKLFTDFFTFRPDKGQRSWLDAHNLLSVLALPFHLMITYSGLIFFAFAYMPMVVGNLYGPGPKGEEAFNQAARIAAGEEARTERRSGVAVPTVSLAALMRDAESRWGEGRVAYLGVIHPNDAVARVTIEQSRGDGLRGGAHLVYDGGGQLLKGSGEHPAGSHAGRVADILLRLHEGHFADTVLRWGYFISGLLGAAMIATGLSLWTAKRRQQQARQAAPDPSLVWVEKFNVGAIAGLCVAVAAYFWANRLLPLDMPGRAAWEVHCLFIVWLVMLAHAAARPARQAWVEQWLVLADLCLLLPILNAMTTGRHVFASLAAGDGIFVGVDVAAVVFGALAMLAAWRCHRGPAPTTRPAKRAGTTAATAVSGAVAA